MEGKVVVLYKDLINAEAFRTLTATAIVVLLDFLGKRVISKKTFKNGNKEAMILNNGEIEYCFSEALKKGMTRPAFNRARDLLLERGFIDITHSGSGGKKGDKNLYAISDRWKKWGEEDFKHVKREKDSRKGVGFAKYWEEKKVDNVHVS